MTKLTRITWQHPSDGLAQKQRVIESLLFITTMALQGKTTQWIVNIIDNNTFERLWKDQESAEAFVEHQKFLADKYGGKILAFEIKDVDNNT